MKSELAEEKAEVSMLKRQAKHAKPEMKKMLQAHLQMEKGHVRELARKK